MALTFSVRNFDQFDVQRNYKVRIRFRNTHKLASIDNAQMPNFTAGNGYSWYESNAFDLQPNEIKTFTMIVRFYPDINFNRNTGNSDPELPVDFYLLKQDINLNYSIIMESTKHYGYVPTTKGFEEANPTRITNISSLTELSGRGNNLVFQGTLNIDQNTDFSDDLRSAIYAMKGSKIVVKSGNTLIIEGSPYRVGSGGEIYRPIPVEGCINRWEGITVEDGGTLIMNYADTKDAEIAVNALNGSNVSIKRTNFEDNKVGVKAGLTRSVSGALAPNVYLGSSKFVGTGSLKPVSGITIRRESAIPDAGIILNNLPLFRIALPILEPDGNILLTTFRNLKVGIASIRTHMEVEQALFEQIENIGIDFVGRNHRLKQTGFGNRILISPHTFYACGVGIRANGASNITISNNILKGSDIGFDVQMSGLLGTKSIEKNYLKDSRVGIRTQFSSTAPSLVTKNIIEVDKPSDTENAFAYQGFESATSGGWVVDNNFFTASKTTHLVHQTSGKGTIFRSNEFSQSLDATFSRLTELRLDGGVQTLVGCNIFSGHSTQLTDIKGMLATGVSDAVYSCNNLENTNLGFDFSGVNVSNVRGNQFTKHTVGLKVREFAYIGRQVHNGNSFFPNCSIGETGVFNENPDGRERRRSTFIVDRAENPNFDGLCPNDNNDGAFEYQQSLGTTFSCSQPLQDCPNGRPGPLFFRRPIDPSDIALIKGDWNAGKYTNAQVWQGRYHLYRRLKQDPDLAVTAAEFQAFLANFGNTSIGQLYKVEAAIADMQTEEYQKSAEIEANLAKMASIETEITAIDEQMNTATGTALSNLLKTRRLKINSLEGYQSQNEQIADNIAVWKAIRVTEIYGLNDVVNADEDVAEYLKTTNKIALESIHRGQSQLNEAQEAAAYAIATLCPLEGGDAVFEARSLLSLNSNMSFNDETICAQSAKQQAIKVKEAPIFKLSPNPAYQELYIDFEGRKANEANLRIANAFGQVISQHLIKGGSNYLDIADLPAGVYYLTVEAKEQRPQTQKLIIVK